MSLWLGINEDLFDSGVALSDGEKVLFASNEERYTRRKNEGGFPHHALDSLFSYTGVNPSDIDNICISGLMTPPPPVRLLPRAHTWLYNARREKRDSFLRKLLDDVTFYLPISHTAETSLLRRISVPFLPLMARRVLPRALKKKPIYFVEHHIGHGAAAWRLSGYEEALVLSIDGMGDGLSVLVLRATPGKPMERLWSASSMNSLGLFFQVLAEAFGFMSCRDEGKITGLAAAGTAENVGAPFPFRYENGRLEFTGQFGFGQRGIDWAKRTLVNKYSREDLAAWAQDNLEKHVVKIAREFLRQTGLRHLAVAGGVVANVKLNQRLHELAEVDRLFVLPNMGDGGLGLGAICARGGVAHQQLRDVFWGESYDNAEIERELREADITYYRAEDIEADTAARLAEGKIVARFSGRMEWGPRALGNRSILVRTTDRQVVERLNRLLKRSDFMPFAPAVLAEDVSLYCRRPEPALHAAEFMTVCFDCTEKMKRENPAIVHLDGTARAQLVQRENNPGFHKILRLFKESSGDGVLLNTSFNIHEEPIIRTPREAVAAFLKARIDYLAIGDFMVEAPAPEQ
ncbi:MAG TPA: hypothetical protein ENN29_12170 [Candidatus Hydrogenedentes bacterium]|nr:hypothetical protein [Candidatus Hydrogenedentota bacterium]